MSHLPEIPFESFFRGHDVVMLLSDGDTGEVTDANEAALRFYGYTLDQLRSMQLGLADKLTTATLHAKSQPGPQRKSWHSIAQHRLANDSIRTVDVRSVPIPVTAKTYLLSIIHDITDRHEADQELYARESYLSAIIENQPGLIWLKDRKGRFLAVNARFASSCGLDNPKALVGKTDWDIWPRDLAARYVADDEKVMSSGKPCTVEEPIADRGTIRWFETFKTPITDNDRLVTGTTGYARDITERKRMEEELQRAHKLESLGVLAGGIAHDFNNLLTGIYGYIDLARSVSKDAQTTEYLESTLASMNRARSLTLQLLTFAKGGAPVQKVVSLVPFIREAVQFALSGTSIVCQFSLPDSLWLCNIDKDQIGQVIDNIVINAVQAMPNGGLVEVVAQNVSVEEGAHHLLTKGQYVKVSIRDSGIGIPGDILPRIFDPFYTTKPKGHGLGLATCHSIISRHGGCIEVESEAGRGSTFHVYLPASTEVAVATLGIGVKRKGSGRIVLVDDDEVILSTVRKMLESLGYTAECRKDGRDAIDFYIQENKAGRRLSGMILDLTVRGGMGGKEAVAEMRKLDKELPVFVASGYADDPVMRSPTEYGFTASLPKPFTIAELSEMLSGKLRS